MKAILTSLFIGLVSFAAYGQEAPDPTNLLLNDDFEVIVMDLVVNETGEVEERFFYYEGEITEKSSDYIMQAIEMYPDVKKIALSSPGGLAAEATELGEIFSDHGIQTWVPKGRVCLSACANAFIGGHTYEIEGILGFHAAWIPEEAIRTMSPSTINRLFGHGQYTGVQDAYYWMVNGFSMQLPAVINGYSSPEKFVVFTSAEELLEYYVRIDHDLEAENQNQLVRYLQWNVTEAPTVWGGVEMFPYLTEQREWLQENSTKRGQFVEVIYSGSGFEIPEEDLVGDEDE